MRTPSVFVSASQANDALIALVSGGFLYLATMTVMPELLEHSAEEGSTLFATAVQVTAFGSGVGMMVIVAALEAHTH